MTDHRAWAAVRFGQSCRLSRCKGERERPIGVWLKPRLLVEEEPVERIGDDLKLAGIDCKVLADPDLNGTTLSTDP